MIGFTVHVKFEALTGRKEKNLGSLKSLAGQES
jgi:hypothetical protein